MKKLSLILGAAALALAAMLTLGCENAADPETITNTVNHYPGSEAATVKAVHVLNSASGYTRLLVVVNPGEVISGSANSPTIKSITIGSGAHDRQVITAYSATNAAKSWSLAGNDAYAAAAGIYTITVGAIVSPSETVTVVTTDGDDCGLDTKSFTVTLGTSVPQLTIPSGTVTLTEGTTTTTLTAASVTDTAAVIYKVTYSSNDLHKKPSVALVNATVAAAGTGVATLPAAPGDNTWGFYVWNGVADTTNADWDKLAPTITSIKALRTAAGSATITVVADETIPSTSGYKIKVDENATSYRDAADSPDVSNETLWQSATENYTVYVKAIDAAGNESAAKSVTVNKYWASNVSSVTGQAIPVDYTPASGKPGMELSVSGISTATPPTGLKAVVTVTDQYGREIEGSADVSSSAGTATVTLTKAKLDSLAAGPVTYKLAFTAPGYDVSGGGTDTQSKSRAIAAAVPTTTPFTAVTGATSIVITLSGATFDSSEDLYIHYSTNAWEINTTSASAKNSQKGVLSNSNATVTFTITATNTAVADTVAVDASALASNTNTAGAVASGVGATS
jgi:hypothetical protein